jgi:hypothetical protein
MHFDGRLNIRAMAMQLNLDRETVRQILNDDFGHVKSFGKYGPTAVS